MKQIFGTSSLVVVLFALSSCGENTPVGPDLSTIDARDHAFFSEIYNRCNIGNDINDCNCIARVNVEHRAAAYEIYAAQYDSIHKSELEAEIKILTATIVEKTANRSDERVLEALEDDLHRLEQKLEAGVDNINDFSLPFLPPGATDECVVGG